MSKEKEILNELQIANILLQTIGKKIDRLILVSKSKKIKCACEKAEGGEE